MGTCITLCGDDLCVTENLNRSLPTTSTIPPSTSSNQETTYSVQYPTTDQLASVRTQSNTWLPRTSQTASTSMQASHPTTPNSHHVDILSTHPGSEWIELSDKWQVTAYNSWFTCFHIAPPHPFTESVPGKCRHHRHRSDCSCLYHSFDWGAHSEKVFSQKEKDAQSVWRIYTYRCRC